MQDHPSFQSISSGQLQLGLRLDRRALFVGDLLAYGTSDVSSRAVQWVINGNYSHVMMYVGDGWVVDAIPKEGVRRTELDVWQKTLGLIPILRHRTAGREVLVRAAEWVKAQIGKPYDFVTAAHAGVRSGARLSGARYTTPGILLIASAGMRQGLGMQDFSFMCSELVFRAFEIAGVPIAPIHAYQSSPAQLRMTSELVYMGNLVGESA